MDTYFYRFIFMRFLFLLSILMFLVLLNAASLSSLQQPLCHDDERSALLQFKDSFILDHKYASLDPSAYPKVASWSLEGGTNTDCCSWDGVDCNDTGHVVGLDLSSSCLYGSINSSNSLFRLLQLQKLNLADNDFNGSQIPFRVGNLLRLTYLNLSFSVFSGKIPSELSHLNKLSSIDLSRNFGLYSTLSDLSSLVQNFTTLEELLLTDTNFSSPIPESLANLSSLTTLNLEDCELHGEFPTRIFQLPNLRDLKIGGNPNLTGHLPEFRLGNPLKMLSIGFPSLRSIPPSLSNLTQLTYLDLSRNTITGHIPSSILANLTQLTHLDLSDNTLTGDIPSSLLANLTQLTFLDLSYNKLSGTLEFDMFLKIKSLIYLYLSSNNLTLLTKPNSNDTLPQFHTLRLASCNLRKLPEFLRSQNKLSLLDLRDNNLEGLVPNWMYNTSRESLHAIILSDNSLIGFEESPVVLPWSNLTSLYLDNNRLQGSLPIPPPSITYYQVQRNLIKEMSPLICNLSSLYYLDLSYNSLSGMLHPCLGNLSSLIILQLRSNNFYGTIPKTWAIGSKLVMIDLSENNFQGQLPSSMANCLRLKYLHVNNNQINGTFPSWLVCNQSSLVVLDLSYNKLGGMLHLCLGNFSSPLSVLQLRSNRFHGPIPKTWEIGSNLTAIDLSENQFQGQLPRSMANCLMLKILHVGNNQINDTFPFWLGALSQLKVIILRSNAFHGAIKSPEINCIFLELHIIDLSQNSFSGNLPIEYFLHWNAMKVVGATELKYMEMNSRRDGFGISIQCAITIRNKRIMLKYEKIPDVFRVIDFSSNRFDGEIPFVLGSLKGLHLLNLSNNALTGHIPSSLGNLTQVESMDLSQNKLSGPIPPQLVELNFLSSFNVSNNRLIGPIPHGRQFDTFDNGSFSGNMGLCGKPLSKQCNSTSEEYQGSEASFEFDWKVVVVGYGCGLVEGAFIGKFVSIRKNYWFMKTFGKRHEQTPRRVNRRM